MGVFTEDRRVLSVLPVVLEVDGVERRMVLLCSPASTLYMSPEQVRAAAQALLFAADLAETGTAQPKAGGLAVIEPQGRA